MIASELMALLFYIMAACTTVTVGDAQELQQAIAQAGPGTQILIAPGTYEGGLSFRDLKGAPGAPIVIAAADPEQPPVIQGGGNCIHLANVSHIELRNLILAGARGNGLNIDDGGTFETPSHHILLSGLVVRDVGPEGNRDGIKLSGVDDFRVENCTVERWGSGGSGIDMVGCHRGVIEGCTFRHGDSVGSNAVQTKGGSRDVVIRRCRFEHAGSRAINIGGSTGLRFFRPKPEGYEAKDITVERCTFIGSSAPVAFVGVDGAVVRHNTIYRPKKWILRILQETRKPEFVPSRNGQFISNIIAFRSDEVATTVNIGSATAPETFRFAHNLWYCLDDPARSEPSLPTPESGGIYGEDPLFQDAEKGDLRLNPNSPAHALMPHNNE
ncbi:nitrous oxide reductase family maturation protein NosD [Candidatus Poribacteria bacterium]